MDITNRVAVVTGGGSGIGEALCVALAEAGAAHVVAVDRNGPEAERVAASIGGTAATVDVADEAAVRQLVEETEAAHGPIGLFVSNAGFVSVGGLEEPDEVIESMWDVHVKAHLYAARAVLPSMIANGEGYLLQTASAAGLLAQIGSLAYTITKRASVAAAEWLAITHYHQGIRVSVLCPQAVNTNIVANAVGNDLDDFGLDDGVASGDGVLESDEVARACLDAIAQERFLVLPHPEVATYVERKGADTERWLQGMRRLQDAMYPDGPLPGDLLVDPS
jgi:NAD(P)-dependent dehydrogenase (short-subunit alcohol dehydrogenase family)